MQCECNDTNLQRIILAMSVVTCTLTISSQADIAAANASAITLHTPAGGELTCPRSTGIRCM